MTDVVTIGFPAPLPATASALERKFAYYWRALGQDAPAFEFEYAFDSKANGGTGRRWRFDFAWPAVKVAVEIEGGMYTRGRHNRADGYAADCEKYNAAIIAGWRVLRYTGDMLRRDPVGVIEQVKRAVNA